jgi:hypothetical protein
MNEYYVPSTKQELVTWIKSRYFSQGQTCSGIEHFPKKRLYAIFYELMSRVKEPQQELVEQS